MKTSRFSDADHRHPPSRPSLVHPSLSSAVSMASAPPPLYKWRSKVGGMDASLIARLKELEEENRRLKKMYAEERLKGTRIISEAMAKVGDAICPLGDGDQGCGSLRHFYPSGLPGVPKVSEGCYRYQPVLADENQEIADWLLRLTANQRNWGFGLCFLYLRNVKGFGWNHKRVYRIYRALELNLRIKPKEAASAGQASRWQS